MLRWFLMMALRNKEKERGMKIGESYLSAKVCNNLFFFQNHKKTETHTKHGKIRNTNPQQHPTYLSYLLKIKHNTIITHLRYFFEQQLPFISLLVHYKYLQDQEHLFIYQRHHHVERKETKHTNHRKKARININIHTL